ncbi:MAG: hypothetical protein PVI37_12665 [Gammaproteobacteria bacterium]|jgi:hypothetical protein
MKKNASCPTSRYFTLAAIAALSFLFLTPAQAVPSFARQTGQPCSTCHTSYPGLTAFGRMFKMYGYTISDLKEVERPANKTQAGLSLNEIPNLSFVLQAGETYLNKDAPGVKNPNASFPKEAGIYYAGRIDDKVGAFLQLTYAAEDGGTSMDMSDIRYANVTSKDGKTNVFGIDVNNGPSFEDVWNSTPGYGWPYVENDAEIGMDMPFIGSEAVMTNVIGVGAYNYWNNKFYAYAGIYQAAAQGNTPPTGDAVSGYAPYLRLAWTPDQNTEVGAFHFNAKYKPDMGGGTWVGPEEKFDDNGIDAQYQIVEPDSTWTFHARYINEKHSGLTSVAGPMGYTGPDSLTANFYQVDANWLHGFDYGASFGFIANTGDRSDYYNLLSNAADGNGYLPNTTPDSTAEVLEFDYYPYQNIRLSAQATIYNKFHGATSNYDGFGRNASDNNTLVLNALVGF